MSFLLLFAASPSLSASVNVDIDDRAYRDLDRLEVKGYLKNGILSTRPISRREAARLAGEAAGEYRSSGRKNAGTEAIIRRLSDRFGEEVKGYAPRTYIKPLENVYLEYVHSDGGPSYFLGVNNKGDTFEEGSNLISGGRLSARFFNVVALSANPEYRLDEETSRGELVTGYARLGLGNLVILAGRDSMWWGSGSHGTLLMTDNARPFDMVKVTSDSPFLLPWIFGRIGLFRPTVFLTRLEKDRALPHPNLLGMRFDFKPTPGLQVALSRVFMFGGEGRKSLTFSDWIKVFTAQDSAEHTGSPTDGNQIASLDVSYVYVSGSRYVPFSGIKLYTEWGAEDSSGETKTPSGRANIYGAYIDEPLWIADFDLRVEWANTARSARYGPQWYYHGAYFPGYYYEGRVIGHHMGTDSRDLFARVQYHAAPGLTIGVEADLEESQVHEPWTGAIGSKGKRKWLAADFYLRLRDGVALEGGAGVEDISIPRSEPGTTVSAWLRASFDF